MFVGAGRCHRDDEPVSGVAEVAAYLLVLAAYHVAVVFAGIAGEFGGPAVLQVGGYGVAVKRIDTVAVGLFSAADSSGSLREVFAGNQGKGVVLDDICRSQFAVDVALGSSFDGNKLPAAEIVDAVAGDFITPGAAHRCEHTSHIELPMVAEDIQIFLVRQDDCLALAPPIRNGTVGVHIGAAVAR